MEPIYPTHPTARRHLLTLMNRSPDGHQRTNTKGTTPSVLAGKGACNIRYLDPVLEILNAAEDSITAPTLPVDLTAAYDDPIVNQGRVLDSSYDDCVLTHLHEIIVKGQPYPMRVAEYIPFGDSPKKRLDVTIGTAEHPALQTS